MVMQDMMISILSLGKLKNSRIYLMKPHSSLSKAFSKSIFRAMRPFLLLEMDIVGMTSLARMMLSLAFRPGMKLAWKGWIRSSR